MMISTNTSSINLSGYEVESEEEADVIYLEHDVIIEQTPGHGRRLKRKSTSIKQYSDNDYTPSNQTATMWEPRSHKIGIDKPSSIEKAVTEKNSSISDQLYITISTPKTIDHQEHLTSTHKKETLKKLSSREESLRNDDRPLHWGKSSVKPVKSIPRVKNPVTKTNKPTLDIATPTLTQTMPQSISFTPTFLQSTPRLKSTVSSTRESFSSLIVNPDVHDAYDDFFNTVATNTTQQDKPQTVDTVNDKATKHHHMKNVKCKPNSLTDTFQKYIRHQNGICSGLNMFDSLPSTVAKIDYSLDDPRRRTVYSIDVQICDNRENEKISSLVVFEGIVLRLDDNSDRQNNLQFFKSSSDNLQLLKQLAERQGRVRVMFTEDSIRSLKLSSHDRYETNPTVVRIFDCVVLPTRAADPFITCTKCSCRVKS